MLSKRLLALTAAVLVAAPVSAHADALSRWLPEYRFERQEQNLPRDFAVYARAADGWLQYWTYYPYNSQDRGITRTGRHEGDWEVVQVRPGRDAVYAQHSWAERCPVHGRPRVYVANGSHAAYFEAGIHDRPWPDPNDEARGDGLIYRTPRLVRISRDSPRWMKKATPWGGTRAGWFPGEMSSPLGPAFQPGRFDAVRFAASARPCGSGAPKESWSYLWVLAVLAAVLGLAQLQRRLRGL